MELLLWQRKANVQFYGVEAAQWPHSYSVLFLLEISYSKSLQLMNSFITLNVELVSYELHAIT